MRWQPGSSRGRRARPRGGDSASALLDASPSSRELLDEDLLGGWIGAASPVVEHGEARQRRMHPIEPTALGTGESLAQREHRSEVSER